MACRLYIRIKKTQETTVAVGRHPQEKLQHDMRDLSLGSVNITRGHSCAKSRIQTYKFDLLSYSTECAV